MAVIRTIAAVAALALVPATAAVAQSMTGQQFAAKAGASDLYEKTSSQLVLATTHKAEVRRFAQTMVRDHTKSTADVKRAAAAAHIRLAPPRLDRAQSRMVAQLRAARGPARDRLYLEQQRSAHQQALDLHSGYAAHGGVPSLRRAAAKIAPVVRHHIDMLRRM